MAGRAKYGGDRKRHNAGALDTRYDDRRYEAEAGSGDRLYTDEERDFLRAAEHYRQRRGKRWLHATDYLQVLKDLGYRRE